MVQRRGGEMRLLKANKTKEHGLSVYNVTTRTEVCNLECREGTEGARRIETAEDVIGSS